MAVARSSHGISNHVMNGPSLKCSSAGDWAGTCAAMRCGRSVGNRSEGRGEKKRAEGRRWRRSCSAGAAVARAHLERTGLNEITRHIETLLQLQMAQLQCADVVICAMAMEAEQTQTARRRLGGALLTVLAGSDQQRSSSRTAETCVLRLAAAGRPLAAGATAHPLLTTSVGQHLPCTSMYTSYKVPQRVGFCS